MLLILTVLNSFLITNALELKGIAKSLDEKEILYIETHKITKDANDLNKYIETSYSDTNGKVFATMKTDFSNSSVLPAITFEDTRFQLKEELSWSADKKSVEIKTTEGEKITKKSFPVTDRMVAGQGFDNFIKINYASIKKAALKLDFGVLGAADFYSFKGYQKDTTTPNADKFGIKISNIILRLFTDELLVEYDPKTKQLVTYKGLSNLMSSNKKSQNVLIKYEIINQ